MENGGNNLEIPLWIYEHLIKVFTVNLGGGSYFHCIQFISSFTHSS